MTAGMPFPPIPMDAGHVPLYIWLVVMLIAVLWVASGADHDRNGRK